MSTVETASLVDSPTARIQDRVAVFRRGSVVVAVVEDGAGGTGGGAAAASFAVERVGQALHHSGNLLVALEWSQLLIDIGQHLERQGVGQTTAVVAASNGSVVVGASVGDSGALVVGPDALRDLTAGQPRKPLLGGGYSQPLVFEERRRVDDTLLLATDGLLKYASADRIGAVLNQRNDSADDLCRQLVGVVRLGGRSLQDDVGLVLLRHLIGAPPAERSP